MKQSWKFEPAVWKGIVVGLVGLLAIWGLDVSGLGEQVSASIDIIAVLIPLVTSAVAGLWIRRSVTPTVAVAEQVTKEGQVVAGPANDIEKTGTVVRVVDNEHLPFDDEYEPQHLDA